MTAAEAALRQLLADVEAARACKTEHFRIESLPPGHSLCRAFSEWRYLEKLARDGLAGQTPCLNSDYFFCPRCESFSEWGTSSATGPKDTWIGHCYGPHGDGCGFSWPRTEDAKHFRPNPEHTAAMAYAKAGT